MKYLIVLLFLSIKSDRISAQQADSIPCPAINILGPINNNVNHGLRLELSLEPFNKKYEKSHTLTYMWVTDIGNIIGDSKKDRISVETKGLVNRDILATVLVFGLEPNCPSTKSITIRVVQGPVGTIDKIVKSPFK